MNQISVNTRINDVRVGTGRWTLSSIKHYCLMKGIQLMNASYLLFNKEQGWIIQEVDITTGNVIQEKKSENLEELIGGFKK